MELELASEGIQGAHEVGGAPRGEGRAPTLVDRVWAPWSSSLARIFYYFFLRCSMEFQVIPRIFVFCT